MTTIHRWWEGRPGEIGWLEVTRRPDIGGTLMAPKANEQGDDFWSYSFVREVKEGDLVYHYDGIAQAIVARSIATGLAWEGELVWAARGSSARSTGVVPHPRPGWHHGVEQYERLSTPITLELIRSRADALRLMTDSLKKEVGQPLYFPFEMGKNRPIRPMRGYLFKLPFLELFGLAAIPPSAPMPTVPARTDGLGEDYRAADEHVAVAERDPFAVDPALVERGVRGHAITQNRLAEHLRSRGTVPRSPSCREPNFDLAWRSNDRIFVAEVKSLTSKNEEKQLRLGLGQALRYAHLLGGTPATVPVLILERCPSDSSWEQPCKHLGVILAWPEVFDERLA